MKKLAVLVAAVLLLVAGQNAAQSQTNSLVLGYSGSGISTDLRRIMDLEKIWQSHRHETRARTSRRQCRSRADHGL